MYKNKLVGLISAMTSIDSRVPCLIGNGQSLPWPNGSMSSDMRRFVQLTKNSSVIMGRKTWDTVPDKYRPFDKNLPVENARQTIVLTSNTDLLIDNPRVLMAHSIEEAFEIASKKKIWVAGGTQVYALAAQYIDSMHITYIRGDFEGDVFFPSENYGGKLFFEKVVASGRLDLEDQYDSQYIIKILYN